jgi:hypothetical protein
MTIFAHNQEPLERMNTRTKETRHRRVDAFEPAPVKPTKKPRKQDWSTQRSSKRGE